jgi:hypothetical protein
MLIDCGDAGISVLQGPRNPARVLTFRIPARAFAVCRAIARLETTHCHRWLF